ncbi:MAG TPA: hypothetical protein VMZ26_11485 [Pyrinomonadaceae bacterium]|nr:hypothetical protein [Pyrinomonadaceae bacterium]
MPKTNPSSRKSLASLLTERIFEHRLTPTQDDWIVISYVASLPPETKYVFRRKTRSTEIRYETANLRGSLSLRHLSPRFIPLIESAIDEHTLRADPEFDEFVAAREMTVTGEFLQ